MKKIKLILLLVLFSINSISAQFLPLGSAAPNFTLTDINNVTYNLYDYTDSGYTVILDISATWCPPCWSFHKKSVFKDLMAHYGPNGSIDPGKVMIFFIEGDTTTNMADLMGATTGSEGDWITGTTYPIIDLSTNSFYSLYPRGGFPTFYTICPNRIIARSHSGFSSTDSLESTWLTYINACPKASNGLNATIYPTTDKVMATCPSVPTDVLVKIQNLGTNVVTNATVEAKINNVAVASANWSGSLNSYDTANVLLTNFMGPADQTNLEYVITTPGDVVASDNNYEALYNGFEASSNLVTLELRTDGKADDISWSLKNSNNTIVASSPVYTAANNNTTYQYPFNLAVGDCYSFEILDVAGTGLRFITSLNDSGFVKLYNGSVTDPLAIDLGSRYKFRTLAKFTTPAPLIANHLFTETNITVYPNPIINNVNYNIDLGTRKNVKVQLLDLFGRVLYSETLNEIAAYHGTLDMAQIANGIYYLKFTAGGEHKMIKVLKE